MICIPITARTQAEIIEQMTSAARLADMVELRLDYAQAFSLEALLAGRPCPVIVTCRPRREGGMYDGAEETRIALLQQAINLGADYVDVELDSVSKLRRGGKTRIIVSRHDFDKTPANVASLHKEIVSAGADIAKIACRVNDIRDNLKLLAVLQETVHPTIMVGMGEAGILTRVLGKKYGNFLTFASLSTGQESAPGQVTAKEMVEMYRYRSISAETAVYGVIGNPIGHSMSPAIHNAAFAKLGIDAVYLPLLVECDLGDFTGAFRALEFSGCSVTVPHKERAVEVVDECDPIARRVGAVNTITHRGGRLTGTNTDVDASVSALAEALGEEGIRGKQALLIGAGGAARAVAYGLTNRGAKVIIANRTVERAERLAIEVGAEAIALDVAADVEADMLINTTTIGMHPKVDESPITPAALRKGMAVMDAVYNPLETKLLRDARKAGCRTVSGLKWFIRQAAAQFELWTGKEAPVEVMEKAARQRLS